MKKRCIVAAVCCALLCFALSAAAEEMQFAVITQTKTLNLRQNASQSSKLLGSYPDVRPVFDELNKAFDAFSPEFLTIYYGADVTVEDALDAKALLGGHFPDADISVVDGGQPVYYYMISAE